MAYTALYRKWRPARFADIVGQDPIVTTLRNEILTGRIGHAYLFCGTRGTGKTSVAKIFSRAVNCTSLKDGEPCGECENCRSILSGSSLDVLEIDAASNNGVDNIRQIREEVRYRPSAGRFRVYIIDEVHMLSAGAYNALLKTLEEPPEYVIFILATTDPQMVPATVKSRCQRYDFHRIPVTDLAGRLQMISREEGIPCDEDALRCIALKADGSMRDAVSLLDECSAFLAGEHLTKDRVLSVLGTADNETFSRLLRCLLDRDTTGALRLIDQASLDGRDLVVLVQDFLWYMRNLLLLMTTRVENELIGLTREDRDRYLEEGSRVGAEEVIRLIRLFSAAAAQMKRSSARRVDLDVALIRAANPEMQPDLEAVLTRLDALERRASAPGAFAPTEKRAFPETGQAAGPGHAGESGSGAGGDIPAGGQARQEQEKPAPRKIALPQDQKKLWETLSARWEAIQEKTDGATRMCLKDTWLEMAGDGRVVIVFHDYIRGNHVANPEGDCLKQIAGAAEALCGFPVEFAIRISQQHEVPPEYTGEEDFDRVFHGMVIEEE